MAKKSVSTRLAILHCGAKLFLEKGYTASYITTIAKELNISTGNLTFYFPTKEHLLEAMVKELYGFQTELRIKERVDDIEPLLQYLREIVIIASICDGDENIKDLIKAAYIHPMVLKEIRENDCKRAQVMFGEYCPTWKLEDYIMAQNLVSGIEFGLIMTEKDCELSLEKRVTTTLDTIMQIYHIPYKEREGYIKYMLSLDIENVSQRVFNGFLQYVEERLLSLAE